MSIDRFLPRRTAGAFRWVLAGLCAWTAATAALATAAPPPVPGLPFELEGTTLTGKPLSLAALRGKVVLVYFWSTGCAVCRSKMPELRANYDGWRGKAFEVVAVSVDAQRADAVAYEQVVEKIVPLAHVFPALWAGDPGFRSSLEARPRQLPLSIVVDRHGRVVARYEGRIPAQAWDTIADLLP